MQNLDATCDTGSHDYDVIEESLAILALDDDRTENLTNKVISFCHFWNPQKCKHTHFSVMHNNSLHLIQSTLDISKLWGLFFTSSNYPKQSNCTLYSESRLEFRRIRDIRVQHIKSRHVQPLKLYCLNIFSTDTVLMIGYGSPITDTLLYTYLSI